MQAITLFFFVMILGCVTKAQEEKTIQPIAVILKDGMGEQVGDVNLTQEKDGVKVVVNLTALPAGTYAFHFHEKGRCQPPAFESAGDHFNPGKKKHGDVKGGPHAGDMKNIEIKSGATGHIEMVNKNVSLRSGPNSLLKSGGTAIVVHEKADDYKTQPSGGAGKRIACGVVKAPDDVSETP